LPSGEHACLRPETTPLDRYRLNPDRVVIADPVSAAPKFIPRDQLHRFIVSSQTVYLVYAETAERALQWFSDPTDIDLDVETLDFGEVEVFGQLSPEEQLDDEPRYWITNQGRVALAEAVSSVVDELREHAAENEVALDTGVAESLVIWADPEGVRTVVRNLLHNGIRAASGGRHVTVRGARADGWVRLEVRDDGVGFPPHEAAHLFEKFYRVDGGASGRMSGTGLGLYLVWRCVSLDGGRVTGESAGPGRGASFTVGWPAATEHES
jgi:signal transduction histidine kinase